ncbi:MAG: A/G-specific adenine glycosylase, partial [bacterium]
NRRTIIQRRSGKGIWEGLFEFPLIESSEKVSKQGLEPLIQKHFGIRPTHVLQGDSIKHLLTHQTIYADFWVVPVPDFDFNRNSDTFEVDLQALGTDFAIPVLLNKFLESSLMNDLCQ